MRRRFSIFVTAAVALSFLFFVPAVAVEIKEDSPERYTVVEGDTLWDISGKYLSEPWRWPELWKNNPDIENPDLIYPGDVLVLAWINGQPNLKLLKSAKIGEISTRETVKLSPKIRITDPRAAIPAIDPQTIQAYLDEPLITSNSELEASGYVVSGIGTRLIMGKYDQFYARAIDGQNADKYQLFRPRSKLVHPVTKEFLGWESKYLGDAHVLRPGDPARLSLLSAGEEIVQLDRLRRKETASALPYFYPKPPVDKNIRGIILPDTSSRAQELGALQIARIDLGERDQIEQGTVLRIASKANRQKDPLSNKEFIIPEEEIGLLMVFRTFEKVSYAIVTNTTREVKPLDLVYSPETELPDFIQPDLGNWFERAIERIKKLNSKTEDK